MDDKTFMKIIKKLQAGELLEKLVYLKISKNMKDSHDKNILLNIASTEQKHYNIWKQYTQCDVKPNMFIVYWYTLLAKVLGYTFTIKIMENRVNIFNYAMDPVIKKQILDKIPHAAAIFIDEEEHEKELIDMIDEEKLQYVGSMVLGLNDALVEFTGSLAGWSFAMQSNKLITLAGLITGISATLSMASSEYLSSKNEGNKNSMKASIYTGIAYLITVVVLLLPYMLLPDNMYTMALIIMIVAVIAIIAAFNYYISVAKNLSFKTKFREMSTVSLSVAAISFIIGLLVKRFLGLDI